MGQLDDVIEPSADLFRLGRTHHAVVDLAGVSASDVMVCVDGREIIIDADRPTMTASADDITLAERSIGRFERRLRLPPDADLSTLTADCTHGLLHLAAAATDTTEAAQARNGRCRSRPDNRNWPPQSTGNPDRQGPAESAHDRTGPRRPAR